MEWFLIIGAVIAWLIYRGSKARKREEKTARRHEPTFSQDKRRRYDAALREAAGRTASWSPSSQRLMGRGASGNTAPAKWIAPGERVKVGGISLDSGMFYFGGMLPGDRPGYGGNCLVDPACNVAASGGDPEGRTVPYWPSYQSISPVARRTFLLWMAGGRNDPSIGIGYVFLFFYGAERRLFVDEAISEAPALIAEVRRLLSIYGSNGSFRGYATRFLDAAELISGIETSCPELSPDLRNGYEMALPVRTHLGRRLASRQRLDSTDALLWLLALPDTYLRTPATRCFDQLVELWHLRFAARYPEGLKVNPPRAQDRCRAAAARMTGTTSRSLGTPKRAQLLSNKR